ncbi:hypothetical protein ABKN59_011441 [Abortiporus biennis]
MVQYMASLTQTVSPFRFVKIRPHQRCQTERNPVTSKVTSLVESLNLRMILVDTFTIHSSSCDQSHAQDEYSIPISLRLTYVQRSAAAAAVSTFGICFKYLLNYTFVDRHRRRTITVISVEHSDLHTNPTVVRAIHNQTFRKKRPPLCNFQDVQDRRISTLQDEVTLQRIFRPSSST